MLFVPKKRARELRHKMFEESKKEWKEEIEELRKNNMFSHERKQKN